MKTINQFILEKLKVKSNSSPIRLDEDDLGEIMDALFDSGEHQGFRKSCDCIRIPVEELSKRLEEYYDYKISKRTYDIIKEHSYGELICLMGYSYDGTWGSVIFLTTGKPYYRFVIIINGDESAMIQQEDPNDIIDCITSYN